MAYLRHLDYEELRPLVRSIGAGLFLFIYESPERWGVFKAGSEPYRPREVHTMVIPDKEYLAPGYHDRPEITYWDERASDPVVDTWGLLAVYDTQEEADAIATRMMELMAVYHAEMAAPKLKLEMGISVLLEQNT